MDALLYPEPFEAIDAEIDEIEATDGPLNGLFEEHYTAKLEQMVADADTKLGWLPRSIRNDEARQEAIDAEITRLRAKSGALARRVEVKRKFVLFLMKLNNRKTFDAGIAKISRLAPRKKLEVDVSRVAEWPEDVYDACVVLEPKVNKSTLKQLFPNRLGELPGVTEVMGEESISIR